MTSSAATDQGPRPTDPRTVLHFVGGEFVPPASDAYLDDLDPARDQVIARVARGNQDDVESAVAASRQALSGEWGKTTPEERAEILESLATGIEQRLEEFAELESLDTGKPIALTQNIDIPRAIANFRFFARSIAQRESAFHDMPAAFNYTLRRRLGVVGLITPWNLPLYLLTWKLAPALIMGNAVIAKPSELTPLTAHRLAEVAQSIGVPKGALNILQGLGAEVGQAMCEHPDIQAISFTGGTVTGRQVASTAAPMFKKLSLELGGKNPTLVFADANIEKAVEGACRAAFTNQGQICLCGSRILVQKRIEREFTEALVERVKGMRLGDPSDPKTELGSLISLDHREKVASYFDVAREEGGEFLCGGEAPDLEPPFERGAFLKPTLIAKLSPRCRVSQEEIFGPVATLHGFEDDEEAISIANGTPYGLSASVWTQNLDRAHRVSEALETGMVWVNTWLLRDLRVPFGGVKQSGVGREGGRYSLDFFSETKNVCVAIDREHS